MKQTIIWKPNQGPQTKLLTCPINDILFGGARGGGKTDGILGDWASHCATHGENSNGIVFRKSTPELEEVIARSKALYLPLGAIFKESKKIWTMPNGARLKMRFLERDSDAEKYQGHSYTWMAFDEAGNWKSPDPIDKLRATLRSAHGIPCRLISTANPGGIGHQWLKERYITPAPPMTPFYDAERKTWRVFIPSRLNDNPHLLNNDPGYVDRIASSGAPWLVKAWLEGDWDAHQEGSIFKREHFLSYIEPPRFSRVVQSWDTAFKKNAENDYSVCLTVGVADNGFYILDRYKGKAEFPELKRIACQLADHYRPNKIYIEDKASGQSLIQELKKGTRLPIFPVKVENDKIARAYSVTPLIESGKVFLPERTQWVHDYLEALTSFPAALHDDDVDATTQVFIEEWLRRAQSARSTHFDFMSR